VVLLKYSGKFGKRVETAPDTCLAVPNMEQVFCGTKVHWTMCFAEEKSLGTNILWNKR